MRLSRVTLQGAFRMRNDQPPRTAPRHPIVTMRSFRLPPIGSCYPHRTHAIGCRRIEPTTRTLTAADTLNEQLAHSLQPIRAAVGGQAQLTARRPRPSRRTPRTARCIPPVALYQITTFVPVGMLSQIHFAFSSDRRTQPSDTCTPKRPSCTRNVPGSYLMEWKR